MNKSDHLLPHKTAKQVASENLVRRNLKLHISPLKTTYYFFLECCYQFGSFARSILRHKILACLSILTLLTLCLLRHTSGPLQEMLMYLERKTLWYGWWILLGFLSSCGLGAGLHTFLLYLGPFILHVTMSAYVCKSVDFPEPPYPAELICPEGNTTGNVSFFTIVRKVELESIFWGFGTAIGELPPYFMARTARLSSTCNTQEIEVTLNNSRSSSSSELETESLCDPNEGDEKTPTWGAQLELLCSRLVTRVGFFGILAFASIPNPLFDLAGMTCGHFLVPFSTFFGATCIGKAIIKAHLQLFSIVLATSEDSIETLVHYIGKVPVVGKSLQQPFLDFLEQQKNKLLKKSIPQKGNAIATIVNLLVVGAMSWFVVSIVNAMAQSYHRRACQRGEICTTRSEKSRKNSSSRTATTDSGQHPKAE